MGVKIIGDQLNLVHYVPVSRDYYHPDQPQVTFDTRILSHHARLQGWKRKGGGFGGLCVCLHGSATFYLLTVGSRGIPALLTLVIC